VKIFFEKELNAISSVLKYQVTGQIINVVARVEFMENKTSENTVNYYKVLANFNKELDKIVSVTKLDTSSLIRTLQFEITGKIDLKIS
jgi:hypothetical protein